MSGKKYERLKTIATKAAPEVKRKLNDGEISQKVALELCKVKNHKEQKRLLSHSNNFERLRGKAQKIADEIHEKETFEIRCALFFIENSGLEKYEEAVINGELLLPPEIDGKLKVVRR